MAGKDKGKTPAGGKPKAGKDDKPTDDSFEPIKVDAKLANTAVLMLDSPEEEVLQKACESIFKFCEKSDGNKLLVHELNATPKIFALTNHEERVIQRNATMALGILSSNSEIRKYFRKYPEYIDKMILLLNAQEFDPLTNEYAAMWIRNMCEDFSTKTVVASSPGALVALIGMLGTSDADAVYNSLGAIERLMDDYQSRKLIREAKGIEPVLGLIKSEFPQIQESAFNTLSKITQNSENREIIRDIGGLEKLVEFLANSEQKAMHLNCLNVLSNCLEDTQCLDLIQQTGGLNRILSYCQDASEDIEMSQINAAAAKALARSARKAENRKILNEQYAEKMLIYLLLSDSDETKAAAAHALSVMAESNFSQDAIRNYEGIETLVRLCNSENSKIREYSCLALSNLSNKNTNNRRHILSNQGVEALMNLLKDEKDTTKAYACVCLTNMACDEIIREEVSQFSFGQSIILAISSLNTFTQAKACLTIASYAVDSSIRNELKTYGVISLLVPLIKSNNDEVRFNACWALTCCSIDESIASEFCKHGAIEILRDINSSSQRKSTFTEQALKKLLEVNLSAKYALTNGLDSTDVILDGFYDMGPMRPNGKFYSLDELCRNPVNDKRPIIIVYAPEEKINVQSEIIENDTLNRTKSKTARAAQSAVGSKTSSKEEKTQKETKEKELKDTKPSKGKKGGSEKKVSTEEISKPISGLNLEEKPKESVPAPVLESYKPVVDKDLRLYIDQAKDFFQNLNQMEQAVQLAKFVSDKLGGPVGRDEVNNLGYELLINESKYELKSNIVPIGKIRLGTYYHRALLFKILADKIHLRSSLERGNYNRAWNVITLKEPNSVYAPKNYIIDLMHEVGKLMPVNSPNAIQYVKLN